MKFYALTSVYKMSHLDGGCELRAPVPYSLPQGKSRFQPQGKSRFNKTNQPFLGARKMPFKIS